MSEGVKGSGGSRWTIDDRALRRPREPCSFFGLHSCFGRLRAEGVLDVAAVPSAESARGEVGRPGRLCFREFRFAASVRHRVRKVTLTLGLTLRLLRLGLGNGLPVKCVPRRSATGKWRRRERFRSYAGS